LTGCLIARPDERGRARLVAADLATVAVTVDVDGVSAIVTPRVLTEESLAPATTATMVDGDAVVVPVHGEVSVRVSEDGRCHRHLAWPAPIVGELPMGEGAMAWSNGTARWPAVGDGYLLTRTTRDGPVSRQALPFRPTSGVWFAGRVYWNAFRTGLGIWTPGAAPELHFRSESFSGAAIEDDRLRLAPLTRDSLGDSLERVTGTAGSSTEMEPPFAWTYRAKARAPARRRVSAGWPAPARTSISSG